MAALSNSLLTFSAIGNREDLSDMIYRIDPTDTPFISMAESEKATAINHEWQTQGLASASTSNFQLEGDDSPTADATTVTTRLGNICQISRKIPAVSGSQRAVDHAGRDDEMAYQEMLKGLELKRDMEAILAGNNQAKVTGNSSTARKLAAVLSWIKTNTDKGASGVDPAAADGTGSRTDGTQRAFTEQQLKNVLKSCYDNGGKPDVIMVGSFNKQQFSLFTGRAQQTEDTGGKKIVAAVDVYVSDFGNLKVVPNRFLRTRDCLVLQSDMWAVAYLSGRKFVSFDMAVTGDNTRKQMLSEYTLVARNEKSSGIVADLTTS
jgi:hypothetical protein